MIYRGVPRPRQAVAPGELTQLSSLHPWAGVEALSGDGPAVPCQAFGLAEELCSSPSSFLGSLLRLSGALMPCLASCQDPVCTRTADPSPMPRESCLPPSIPSSFAHAHVCSLSARPLSWHPECCRYCLSHAKPLCFWHAGARVRSVLCWSVNALWSGCAQGTPSVCPATPMGPCARAEDAVDSAAPVHGWQIAAPLHGWQIPAPEMEP